VKSIKLQSRISHFSFFFFWPTTGKRSTAISHEYSQCVSFVMAFFGPFFFFFFFVLKWCFDKQNILQLTILWYSIKLKQRAWANSRSISGGIGLGFGSGLVIGRKGCLSVRFRRRSPKRWGGWGFVGWRQLGTKVN